MQQTMDRIFECVVAGDRHGMERAVREALEAGALAEALLRQSLVPAMDEVGRRFDACAYYVPEMLASAQAMKAGLTLLKPELGSAGPAAGPCVVLGTVQGDLHDIG